MAIGFDLSKWFKAGAFSLFNRIAVVSFGFLNVFFMVRMMPPSDIGVWVLFTSITSILETIRNGFIRNPFVIHYVSAENDFERASMFMSSFFLHACIGLMIGLSLLGGASALSHLWASPELFSLFLIYSLTSLAFVPYLQFEYLLQSTVRFRAIFTSNVVRLLIPSVYIIVYYIFNLPITLNQIAIVQLVSTVVAGTISFIFIRNISFSISGVNRKIILKLVHFGKYTFGTTISSMVMSSTDSWMLGKMVSTRGVAMYNPALRISNLVEVPTLAIASLVFPQVHRKMQEQGVEGVRDLYMRSVGLILAMIIPVSIVLYFGADIIVTLIFGSEYAEAIPVLQVTVFYTLIIPFNRQFGTVMDTLKQPKTNFLMLLATAVCNVVFNYFLITNFGVIGAAFGTLGSYLLFFIQSQIMLYKKFGINPFKMPVYVAQWYAMGWSIIKKKLLGIA